MFQELDERINFVATKVIHLGDQLESVNTPRSRAVQAQKLMNHFAEFITPGPVMTDFTQVKWIVTTYVGFDLAQLSFVLKKQDFCTR